MNIYVGKNKKEAEKVSLYKLLNTILKNNGIETNSGIFSDDSCAWVGIVKTNDKKQITVNLRFEPDDLNNIVDIGVFEAKIITVVDEDNAKCII